MAVYLERRLLFVYVNFDWFLKDFSANSKGELTVGVGKNYAPCGISASV